MNIYYSIDDDDRVLPKPPDCGHPTHNIKRSYGSHPVNITSYPWMVALQYRGEYIEDSMTKIVSYFS